MGDITLETQRGYAAKQHLIRLGGSNNTQKCGTHYSVTMMARARSWIQSPAPGRQTFARLRSARH